MFAGRAAYPALAGQAYLKTPRGRAEPWRQADVTCMLCCYEFNRFATSEATS